MRQYFWTYFKISERWGGETDRGPSPGLASTPFSNRLCWAFIKDSRRRNSLSRIGQPASGVEVVKVSILPRQSQVSRGKSLR
jgi:hypothetical protein